MTVYIVNVEMVKENDTAELDADANNEYELYVECTDGTDTTQAFLRVEITKDQIVNFNV
jgi:hypothetical protein